MFDVCVVGGCGIDRIFVTGEDGTIPDIPDSVVPAGKGSNQAVAASRAGASVCIVTCVGDDDNGDIVISNMMKEGIIDPVKVTKSALSNAISVSATLLTTEAAVADIKEATPAAPQPDMGY